MASTFERLAPWSRVLRGFLLLFVLEVIDKKVSIACQRIWRAFDRGLARRDGGLELA